MHPALQGAVKVRAANGQPFPRLAKLLPWIVAQNRGCQLRQVELILLKKSAHRAFLSKAELVQALGQPVQQRIHASLGAAHRQPRQPLP
jgi:hypothetical protein